MPAPDTIPPGHRPIVTFHLPVDPNLFCHIVESAGPDTALTNVNGSDQTIVLSAPVGPR